MGQCINNSGETLLVYGPRLQDETRDNQLYKLANGRKTSHGWDCDGFYVPKDRVANQLIDKSGPVAVKYIGPIVFNVTKNGAKLNANANQGVFTPHEVCCPSNWPTCVCWEIPNLSTIEVENSTYPTAPLDPQ